MIKCLAKTAQDAVKRLSSTTLTKWWRLADVISDVMWIHYGTQKGVTSGVLSRDPEPLSNDEKQNKGEQLRENSMRYMGTIQQDHPGL